MNLLRPLTRTFLRPPLLLRQPPPLRQPLLIRQQLLRPLPNHFPLPRHNSTQPPAQPIVPAQPDKPSYDLTFTCRPCTHRSTHRISKQAYHTGSVLITCPRCSNRHVITDHLKMFSETERGLEDILREKGEVLKKGAITAGGYIEYFPEEREVQVLGSGEEEKDKV